MYCVCYIVHIFVCYKEPEGKIGVIVYVLTRVHQVSLGGTCNVQEEYPKMFLRIGLSPSARHLESLEVTYQVKI